MATSPKNTPLVQTSDRNINQLQSNIVPQLNNLSKNPVVNNSIITGQALIAGATTFNHKLGRIPSHWYVTDQDGAATIYRSQPFNATTLTLTSSAAVTCNVVIF
jgi:hypothetical protein